MDRRSFVRGGAALVGAAALGGCNRVTKTNIRRHTLELGEDANLYVQRLLLSRQSLAPEYTEADLSSWFKPNGTYDPPDKGYKALARRQFRDCRLVVGGLVDKSIKLSLAELRARPSRTQITRLDCVEGWSCIGKWTGVPMQALLERTGLKPNARYVVLYCADTMEGGEAEQVDDGNETNNPQMEQKSGSTQSTSGGSQEQTSGSKDGKGKDTGEKDSDSDEQALSPVRYYETIDLTDAFHPQTILAYDVNDKPLPVAHGAPLRLRLERQLGYKMAKYVMRLDVVESFHQIGQGRGGYWEDNGYEWYAGI